MEAPCTNYTKSGTFMSCGQIRQEVCQSYRLAQKRKPRSLQSDIGPQGSSLTISARGHMFENHFADKRQFIQEMTNQSVPVWHPGQERYRWGGCKHCAHLSLQPHVNRRSIGAVKCTQICLFLFHSSNGADPSECLVQRSCTSCRVYSHSVDATQGEGRKIR